MYLSFLENDEIVKQIKLPEGLFSENVIDIDNFLHSTGILKDHQEIAITHDLDSVMGTT